MSRAAAVAVVLAVVLLTAVAAAAPAHADRLDEAARALRKPGVWVDADLLWLVSPRAARRLSREIDRAPVPVRVAVMPKVEEDESRGDQRAILRGIVRRVRAGGLYVLADQDGDVVYAAHDLRRDIRESSFPTGIGLGSVSLSQSLAAIVPAMRAAQPAAPVSFEPFSDPQGIRTSGGGNHDSLLLVGLLSALFGAVLGVGLHFCLRGIVALTAGVRRRA